MGNQNFNPWIIVAIGVVIAGVVYLGSQNCLWECDLSTNKEEVGGVYKTTLNSESSTEQLKDATDGLLSALLKIHYVSLTDIEYSSVETFILEELTESLNDKSKLERVVYDVETFTDSDNEIVATTAFVIRVTVLTLIQAYDAWISYLRGVDEYTLDVAEFQYELASFQSKTHQAYLSLVEGVSLFPGIVIVFATEEEGTNSINFELRDYFSQKIDDLFSDILVDDDTFHAETGNRYAVAVIVRSYKSFLTGGDK